MRFISLQEVMRRGLVAVQAGDLHPDIGVHLDAPTGKPRYTYAKVVRGRPVAIAILAFTDRLNGVPVFHLGYAVAEDVRGQGLATEIVSKGIDEIRNGLGRHGKVTFYLEAVVGVKNEASHCVARKFFSEQPTSINDGVSGEPALQYLRQISTT
jgi:hypothetical protein